MKLDDKDIKTIENMCLFEKPEDAEHTIKHYFKENKFIDVYVDIDNIENFDYSILVYYPIDKLYIPEEYRILEMEVKKPYET